jgi:hypothetical protein
MRFRCLVLLVVCCAGSSAHVSGEGLTETSMSPHVTLRGVDIDAARWTDGFRAERFDWCHRVVIPNMWRLLGWSAVPGLLGVAARCLVPESPGQPG